MNVREIAKLANVSIATVSRVINRPEVVQPETRAHVLSVMRAHNYNPAARGAAARTGSICLLAEHAGDYLIQRLLGWKVWPHGGIVPFTCAARAAARRTNCCARQSGSGSTA